MAGSDERKRPKLLDRPSAITRSKDVHSHTAGNDRARQLLGDYGIGARKAGQVVVAVDCSLSMSSEGKLAQAREGAVAFADDAFKKGYRVGLVSFDSGAKLLLQCGANRSEFREAAQGLKSGGSTNMVAALEECGEALTDVAGVRAIVLATDGQPDDPAQTLALAETLKKAGVDIITIGTSDADAAFLRRLASRTDLAQIVPTTGLLSGISGATKLLPGLGTR